MVEEGKVSTFYTKNLFSLLKDSEESLLGEDPNVLQDGIVNNNQRCNTSPNELLEGKTKL